MPDPDPFFVPILQTPLAQMLIQLHPLLPPNTVLAAKTTQPDRVLVIDREGVCMVPAPALCLPATLQRTGSRRKQEFLAGRQAASLALQQLGYPCEHLPIGLPIGPHGLPVWPKGYLGSIAHSAGYAVALASPVGHFSGVGIDLESAQQLPQTFLTPQEQQLTVLGFSQNQLIRMIFAAKESAFKATFTQLQKPFDPLQWQVTKLCPTKAMVCSVLPHGERFTVQVRQVVQADWVLSCGFLNLTK